MLAELWGILPGCVRQAIGDDRDAHLHDLQAMAERQALRYCAVEAVDGGEPVAAWRAAAVGETGQVLPTEPVHLPPTHVLHRCGYQFVVYLRRALAPFTDRLVLRWEPLTGFPWPHETGVVTLPGNGRAGAVRVPDGTADLLPQDARGLRRGDEIACLIGRDTRNGRLVAFLAERPGAASRTRGWTARPRDDAAALGVERDGVPVPHAPGVAGCPACRELGRGRVRRRLASVSGTLAVEVAVAVLSFLFLLLSDWLGVPV